MIINSYVKIKVKEFVCLILPKTDQLLILLLHSTGKSIFPKVSVKYVSLMFLPFMSTVFSICQICFTNVSPIHVNCFFMYQKDFQIFIAIFLGLAGMVYFLCDILDPSNAKYPAYQVVDY